MYIYVCMYVRICVYMYVCMYVCTYVCMESYIYVYIYIYMYVCTCMYGQLCRQLHACIVFPQIEPCASISFTVIVAPGSNKAGL